MQVVNFFLAEMTREMIDLDSRFCYRFSSTLVESFKNRYNIKSSLQKLPDLSIESLAVSYQDTSNMGVDKFTK